MLRFLEMFWFVIAIVALAGSIYLLLTRSFSNDTVFMIVTFVLAAFMSFVRRQQRKNMEK